MEPAAVSQSQPVSVLTEKRMAWLHWPFTVLLRCRLARGVRWLWSSVNLPGKASWPEALLLLLAAVGTIAALARHLPLQNILLAALRHRPRRRRGARARFEDRHSLRPVPVRAAAGPKLFKTLPWAMPLVWVVAMLNSRGVARLILRPWRKIQSLRLLAHRPHGGADGAV